MLRHGFAVDEGLGDMAALGQFGLDPFRVHVAAETGDELMLLAPLEVEKALGVEFAEIAAGPPFIGVRRFAQIAEQGRALDQHFAVVGQANLHVGQGPADTAGAARLWPIEAHHRGALRQSVAFVNR